MLDFKKNIRHGTKTDALAIANIPPISSQKIYHYYVLKRLVKLIIFILPVFYYSDSFAQDVTDYLQDVTCVNNAVKQQARSKELQKLANADQRDRDNWMRMRSPEIMAVSRNDIKRRKRVGEIFGEGCLKSANDYYAAALIYQHGDTPDHYYQTYLWATHAAALGNIEGKPLAAMAIDRYLVSIGKKQLFGSQFFAAGAPSPNQCYCMQPVEPSFSDRFRKKYSGYSLRERYDLLASINKGKDCLNIECNSQLQNTPKGSVPGLW
ncbi:MAG: Uncharacterized protein K0S27_1512 [Gammaproteobacteria bacterium]|jgi:hypothetical protein|nr:Uncharacterized protein [Gammaproteobacteria bacterium]